MKDLILAGTILLVSFGCTIGQSAKIPPPDVVAHVDLNRYTGTWYEIASFPQRFQQGCRNTKAVYTLKENGTIEVLNSCFRNNGIDTAKGRAWVVDATTNAKLKVSFFWPFRGDYWIIELGKEYEYAVVGNPDRKYCWILSRTTRMDKMVYEGIVKRLQEKGFDTGKLQLMEHQGTAK